jgi:hypothetical protein
MSRRLSFGQLLVGLLVISFVVGFAVYVMAGATTDKGTTKAIASENASIMKAEKARCSKYGSYASVATLRQEGFLSFEPAYNSVVYLPGSGCGTIIVGSPAYQSPAS